MDTVWKNKVSAKQIAAETLAKSYKYCKPQLQ